MFSWFEQAAKVTAEVVSNAVVKKCSITNDTEYNVVIVDYDGTRDLPPHTSQGNYLVNGFHLDLVIEFGDNEETKKRFPASDFEDRDHQISQLFKEEIENYIERGKNSESSVHHTIIDTLPDISPVDVFERHASEVLGAISSADVDSFVVCLISADVISNNDLTMSLSSDSHHEKLKMALDAVQNYLVKTSNLEEKLAILVKFSAVLSSQNNNDALQKISNEFRGELISFAVRPEVYDLYRLLRGRIARWEDIGIELKVDGDYIDQLRREGVQSSDSSKLERVLRTWEESMCTEVTWRQAVRVFRILKFDDVFESTQQFLRREDILEKYLPSV